MERKHLSITLFLHENEPEDQGNANSRPRPLLPGEDEAASPLRLPFLEQEAKLILKIMDESQAAQAPLQAPQRVPAPWLVAIVGVWRAGQVGKRCPYAQRKATPRNQLALVWDGQQVRMFFNGELKGWHTNQLGKMPKCDRPIVLGSKWQGADIDCSRNHRFAGLIDEVRISRSVRYPKSFESESFAANESTVLLYDFSERDGEALHDRSGNGGRIFGAR